MRGEDASEPATPTPPPPPSLPPPPAAPEESGIHEFEQLELSRLVDLQTRSILQPLDDNIVQVIEAGCIRLVDADWLRDTDVERIPRRQDLEAMHTRALLPPAKGAALILKGEREVSALTYGWRTRCHPDPEGATLKELRQLLKSSHGAHIKAVFWDFPSLHQHPRTDLEAAQFKKALTVMGDLYASVLGTGVVRLRAIPPRPAEFDGKVIVDLGVDLAASGEVAASFVLETISAHLSAHGTLTDLKMDGNGLSAMAQFETHAQAEAAMAATYATEWFTLVPAYNALPYPLRGWTTFESAVSTEGLAKASFMPSMLTRLEQLPPKLIDLRPGQGPEVVLIDADPAGAGPRIETVIAALGAARFIGKGDQEMVTDLYRDYVARINNAFNKHGEGVKGGYEGERNHRGQPEGHGTARAPSGNVYIGQWKAGKMDGVGRYIFADGDVYEGDYVAGQKFGRGTYAFANGDLYVGEFKDGVEEGHGCIRYPNGDGYNGEWVGGRMHGHGTYLLRNGGAGISRYEQGVPVGRGAEWDASRQNVIAIQDGQDGEEITSEEAATIAAGMGLQVPSSIKSICIR